MSKYSWNIYNNERLVTDLINEFEELAFVEDIVKTKRRKGSKLPKQRFPLGYLVYLCRKIYSGYYTHNVWSDKQTISSLVTGGEASAGPPLGPAMGPMGVNIMQVIEAINEKTKEFKGMKIPVTVSVDADTKEWEIEVGIPSASALLLKEAGIQKGSSTSGTEWAGDITADSIVKVANVKLETSYASSLKSVAKQIVGTCVSLGIKIEGKTPKEFTAEINDGKWDSKFT